MKKIENYDGSVTYRVEYDDIGVQQTLSRCTLETFKRIFKDNWYELKIHNDLLRKYIELLHEKRRLSN